MASPPPFPTEDQTDEDFFDRLVEDDFGVTGSHGGSAEMDGPLFGTGVVDEKTLLEDSGYAGLAAGYEDGHLNRAIQGFGAVKEGALYGEGSTSVGFSDIFTVYGDAESVVYGEKIADAGSSCLEAESEGSVEMKSEVRSPDSSAGISGGSKSTGVKEVQWSAFSVDSPQFSFSGAEPFSDFLIENSGVSTNQLGTDSEFKSSIMDTAAPGADIDLVSSEQQVAQLYGAEKGHSTDVNDPKYWENLYPGWKFDAITGQWCQVDVDDARIDAQQDNWDAVNANVQEGFRDDYQGAGAMFKSGTNMNTEVSYSQQTSSLMIGAVAEDCKTSTVSNWYQNSQGSNGYPANIVFDPQYPGWYYDTNTQQWATLESYTQSILQAANSVQSQVNVEMNTSYSFNGGGSSSFYGDVGILEQNGVQGQGNQDMAHSLNVLTNNFAQHRIQHSDTNKNIITSSSGNQQMLNLYDAKVHEMNNQSQQVGFNSWYPIPGGGYNNSKGSDGFQNFIPAESMHQFDQRAQNLQSHLPESFYADEKSINYHEQQFRGTNISDSHISYSGNDGRSSAGRPSHALVTFGFGGKIVVMKDSNTFGMNMSFDSQESSKATVSILNLMDVVNNQAGNSGDYFHSLCQQSFPGPLVGGSAATKDVYKWIDDSITHCESSSKDQKKRGSLKLLLSLLKVSFQHYGKLRSPFGSGLSNEDSDGPELAVTKLFASVRANGSHLREYNSCCLQSIPSEGHLQAIAIQMQNLLVSGKRKEALHCAQVGQLWGPALVLAAQLGEKSYVDTVKQMSEHLLCGSPLRTLCLLIAGQPADVFSTESSTKSSFSGISNGNEESTQVQSNCMLDDWEENLAIITSNRTKDDELVVIHLGDCLWKDREEVTAAHTCYLVAEANFEPYSDSSRLCLIGADHWKYPRTYASPDAIQRTELYEYSKVLGNSQFVLLPFQPYKFVYANMLAEMGKISDSLRYCQASMKLLRNSGRTPEVEMWKSLVSSLEDRLCSHQQGGYSENLAPAKLVGKLFTSIDRSIHRMMGAPSSLPPVPQTNANSKEGNLVAPKVVNSQSTMTMSSLIPSASVEGMSEWSSNGDRKSLHSRSISEPNFGRTPKQDAGPGDAQNKASPSRFGRIGSQLFQKTMGWVAKSRSDRQAKLGESNKFYYDEKLKRWVEEGAEPPAEETFLPPPPKAASFQNGTPEYNINNAFGTQLPAGIGSPEIKSPMPLENSGIPPMSPSPNQFSARGRMGVRSRYVDTFNKGSGSSTSSFQSPSAPAVKPATGAKFFVPMAPSPSSELMVPASGEGIHEAAVNGDISTSTGTELLFNSPTPPISSSAIQRFPSMDDNIDPYNNKETAAALQNGNGFLSGSGSWDTSSGKFCEANPLVVGVGAPSSFFPSNHVTLHSSSSSSQQLNGSSSVDDLHEVELS